MQRGNDVKCTRYFSFVGYRWRGFRSVIVSCNDNSPAQSLLVSKHLFISVPLQLKFLAKRSVSRRLIRPWFEGHERQWRLFREYFADRFSDQFSLETRSEIFELSNESPRLSRGQIACCCNLQLRPDPFTRLKTNLRISFLSILRSVLF